MAKNPIGWAEPTSKPRYLRIRNFERYQSEKMKNQPLWVQIWTKTLLNYEFQQLPDAAKWHFIGLILLAAQTGNRFPNNPAWLAEKIGASSEIDIDLLLKSRHLEGCKRLILNSRAEKKTKSSGSPEQNKAEQSRTEQTKAHTDTKQEPDTETEADGKVSCVCLGKFPLEDYLRYVERCRAKGQRIDSPEGLAIKLHRSGEADALVEAVLYPERFEEKEAARFGKPREFTDANCSHCYGSKMEVVEGKGARPCAHCIDERGRRTGFEPKEIAA